MYKELTKLKVFCLAAGIVTSLLAASAMAGSLGNSSGASDTASQIADSSMPIFGKYEYQSQISGNGCFGLESDPGNLLAIKYWDHADEVTVSQYDGRAYLRHLVYSNNLGVYDSSPSPRGVVNHFEIVLLNNGKGLHTLISNSGGVVGTGSVFVDATFELSGVTLTADFRATRGDAQTTGKCLLKKVANNNN